MSAESGGGRTWKCKCIYSLFANIDESAWGRYECIDPAYGIWRGVKPHLSVAGDSVGIAKSCATRFSKAKADVDGVNTKSLPTNNPANSLIWITILHTSHSRLLNSLTLFNFNIVNLWLFRDHKQKSFTTFFIDI